MFDKGYCMRCQTSGVGLQLRNLAKAVTAAQFLAQGSYEI